MDVLKPSLMWIDGRCFRTLATDVDRQSAYEEESPPDLPLENLKCDEPCDTKYNIVAGKEEYYAECYVPNAYYGNIIGTKGSVKKRLASETKTCIRVPNSGETGPIRVSGKSKRSVLSALNRIDLIVESARQKQPFTHFLCLPFVEERMKHTFLEFQTDVLRECSEARGVDKSLFQNPDKLHLTIGTMPLMDKLEREKAVQILQDCEEIINAILCGKQLLVCVQGIEYMNDDPSEVDILYAKLRCSDGSNKLQMLADQLVEKFVGEGIMQRQYERVKLHITIMNTLFRRDQTGVAELNQRDRRHKPRESFDATDILKKFGDHRFGEVAIQDIHLSLRHNMGRDGFYACTGKLQLKPQAK